MELGDCKPYHASISSKQCSINREKGDLLACKTCNGLENVRAIANVQPACVPKEGVEVFVGEEVLVVMFSGEDKEIIESLMEHSNDLANDIATIVHEFMYK